MAAVYSSTECPTAELLLVQVSFTGESVIEEFTYCHGSRPAAELLLSRSYWSATKYYPSATGTD